MNRHADALLKNTAAILAMVRERDRAECMTIIRAIVANAQAIQREEGPRG
jgi:hypothetical protein